METAVAPVQYSSQLQFQISAGAAGLGGRRLQSACEDLNEKAGCGEGAQLSTARLRGFLPTAGVKCLWGGRGFAVRVTRANSSEPQHCGGCFSAEDSEDSFIDRTLKVKQVSAFGETRRYWERERGPARQSRCASEQVARVPHHSRSRDTLFRTVGMLCAGIQQTSVRKTGPLQVSGSHNSERCECVSLRQNLILKSLVVVGGVLPGGR